MTDILPMVATRFVIVLLLGLVGCGPTISAINSDGTPKFKFKFENPEDFEVNSNNYPIYRVETSITNPPLNMVNGQGISQPTAEIFNTDNWKVTHVYNGYYYIFSNEFQHREEQLIKKSYSWNVIPAYYLYHLSIDKNGKVIGGWVLFKNKKEVALKSDRRIVLDPFYHLNPEWDKQSGFVEVK